MAFVGVARQAGDDAARIVLPIRRVQPAEGRDEINAAVILHGARQRLDVAALFDQAEVVANPLHQRAGNGHAAFQRVDGRLRAEAVRDRGQHAVLASAPAGSPVFISRKHPVP